MFQFRNFEIRGNQKWKGGIPSLKIIDIINKLLKNMELINI